MQLQNDTQGMEFRGAETTDEQMQKKKGVPTEATSVVTKLNVNVTWQFITTKNAAKSTHRLLQMQVTRLILSLLDT